MGGENVAAAEVESHLLTHPAVEIAQVVSAPDARYAEVPAAFVQLATGHDRDRAGADRPLPRQDRDLQGAALRAVRRPSGRCRARRSARSSCASGSPPSSRRRESPRPRSSPPRADADRSALGRSRSPPRVAGRASPSSPAVSRRASRPRSANPSTKPVSVGIPETPIVAATIVAAAVVPIEPPIVRMIVFIPVATPVWSGGTAETMAFAIAGQPSPRPTPMRAAPTKIVRRRLVAQSEEDETRDGARTPPISERHPRADRRGEAARERAEEHHQRLARGGGRARPGSPTRPNP